MNLNLTIHNIKSIKDLTISLPTEKGLYAITGQNGSGKSTICTCASRAFYKMKMEDYFGKVDEGAYIKCELNGIWRNWTKGPTVWNHSSNGRMQINGFYEGSLIFGNRFRNASYEKLKQSESINWDKLVVADDFIRKNMGEILQNDPEYYDEMWYTGGQSGGYIFYYEKNGKKVSQYHMSTGENLLVSILNSIYLRDNNRHDTTIPCMFFLDEIELALHPSSLKKLLFFLRNIAINNNYAIYFSTHSIELISAINPNNIFYIQRHSDNSMEVTNPCYPAYATKFLYDHSGYDRVILVEDDLSREILRRIIKKEALLGSKLIHILPSGGWHNVLKLADECVRNNLMGPRTSICVVLDQDIEEEVDGFKKNHNISSGIPINYLPVESLEKYLKSALVEQVDHQLFRRISDYIFVQTSLQDLVFSYKTSPQYKNDITGKEFFKILETEMRNRGVERTDLIEIIVDYLYDNGSGSRIDKLRVFLISQMR